MFLSAMTGLIRSNFGLLESGVYFDLTIACKGSEWAVHKAVVCPKSKYFAAVCKPGFQVNTTLEC